MISGFPSVAIILINYNGSKVTLECLQSLQKLTATDFCVFLVDNGSTSSDVEFLKHGIEKLRLSYQLLLIETGINLGYAGGNNTGIRHALEEGHELFWLLNNDTEVNENSLVELQKVISEKAVGIAGSKIYYFGSRKIWYAGASISMVTGNAVVAGKNEEDAGQYDGNKFPQFITGCSMLIKKEVIEQIGYLKEDYFMYYEDADYCMRARNSGWGMVLAPLSVVYHKAGASSDGYENPLISYYIIRNRFAYIRRFGSVFQKVSALIYLWYKSIKNVYLVILRKDKKMHRIRIILFAVFHAMLGRMGRL